MSLCIVRTPDEHLVSDAVVATLGEALAAQGRATLLVPDLTAQLAAARELSTHAGLSLGVTIATPSAWARELWEVWGDGSRIIDGTARSLLVGQVLAQTTPAERGGVEANPGTELLMQDLARRALPWLPLGVRTAAQEDALGRCTEAERHVIHLVGTYATRARAHGLVEESEVMARLSDTLARQGVAVPPIVALCTALLPRAERELVVGLARLTDVRLQVRTCNSQVDAAGEAALADLLVSARAQSVEVSEQRDTIGWHPRRADELTGVLRSLFSGKEGAVEPTGAVVLLEAAGPTAEAELVARHSDACARTGATRVVVSVPDTARAWRELAPKLQARGISVRAQLARPFGQTEAGRALAGFMRGVARLHTLDATWPASKRVEEGTLIRLGSMEWWPPSNLIDFLLSGVSHVPAGRAYRLDAAWRKDRLLTPADVLSQLQNERLTSPSVAHATRELLRGRVGSMASKLLAPLGFGDQGASAVAAPASDSPDARADAEAAGALTAVMDVAGTLRELGITADPAAEGSVDLETLVDVCCRALEARSIRVRPQIVVPGAPCVVDVMDAPAAARLAAGSADALICCGQTSEEAPVGTGDDVLTALLEALGIEPPVSPLDLSRTRFAAALAVPTRHLALERVTNDADSKRAYPSVMLTELLACYGWDAQRALPVETRDELAAAENVSSCGAPAPQGVERVAPAGQIDPSKRPFIVVPQEGSLVGLVDGRPQLSASQLESYLECPYKWFSLRRLRLETVDAGFGAMEMGAFAHRVLEVTHRTLLDDALGALAEAGEPVPDLVGHPELRVAASRVSSQDASTLRHAREVLDEEFAAHLRHQGIREGKRRRPQPFVPHTALDEGMLATLRKDLRTLLDFESTLLVGYEPRHFEWDFGRGDDLVDYAGAYLRGTIDRVDVDAHGQAVVIDYKHKSPATFRDEYAAFPREGPAPDGTLELPRRVQSLIYGQVVRRRHPNLKVVGAVYLATKGDHALAGAVRADACDRVFGDHLPGPKMLARMAVPEGSDFRTGEAQGMDGLLDATEELIRAKVQELLEGRIEARPKDRHACEHCPVMNCERRLNA